MASTVRASAFPALAPHADDISIPPASTDPPADLDDRFFAEGEAAAHADAFHSVARVATARAGHPSAHESDAHHVVVPPERRKKLANYVKTAVGFSALLCLAALVRVGIVHANANAREPSEATHVAAAVQPPQASAAAIAPVVLAAPPAPVTPAAAGSPAQPAPPADATASAAGAAAPVAPEAEPATPAVATKTAKEEKEVARRALERGKRKDAIEAGQRSVDLDATDAEAWLILGSAQQDAGHWKEAHESFVSCTKEAKTGPIKECRMMLR